MNDTAEATEPMKPSSHFRVCLYDSLSEKVVNVKVGSVIEAHVKLKVTSVEQRKDKYTEGVEKSGEVSGDVQSVTFSAGKNAYEELAEDD